MESTSMYIELRKRICRKIFDGTWPESEPLPPERKLAEDFGVSRVTVRKSLELLEQERIIQRVQGSGTRITLDTMGHPGSMEIITLMAPAQNTFFSRFIDSFQQEAEQRDSLVLFRQKPAGMSAGESLWQLYERGLRNVVLWPEDMNLEQETLRRLRGLGMNMVIFDAPEGGAYADSVCLDNRAAITALYEKLKGEGCSRIGYVGWEPQLVTSIRLRLETYLGLEERPVVVSVPWTYHNRLEEYPAQELQEKLKELSGCDGVIYSVAELGMLFEGAGENPHRAVMVDSLPGAVSLGIDSVEQNFDAMSARIFDCLCRQNEAASHWVPENYLIPGIMRQERSADA